MELEFNKAKLTLELEAQSPHIHFQHNELGVTLRASELKPKLDKFLKRKMNNNSEDALDYKVSIIVKESKPTVELGVLGSKGKQIEESYSIYFANVGVKEEAKKIKGIWANSEITFICFNNEIKKCIQENIVEFFYVTNFGTMQNKGFGSYKPIIKEKIQDEQIMDWLMDNYSTTKAWKRKGKAESKVNNSDCLAQMDWIKRFYGIMKSGQSFGGYERSYLFEYMHKNDDKAKNTDNIKTGIDNEKAWMKQKGIAPIYSKNGNNKHDREDKNSKYVRGFLGMSGTQAWQSERGRKNITITGDKEGIERIPSPVFFKIVNNNIFFVIENIVDELYDKEFEFSGFRKGNLKTPKKNDFVGETFDTAAFMKSYVEYYNDTLASKYFNNVKIEGREK